MDKIRALEAKAMEGDPEAQHRLALKYLYGDELSRNERLAMEWTLKAAEQGFAEAQATLGFAYFAGEWGLQVDESKSFKWYTLAAEKGYPAAQHSLGQFYADTDSEYYDPTKAIDWFTKAAEQGEVLAQKDLGEAYLHGLGVSQDYCLAATWLFEAAMKWDNWRDGNNDPHIFILAYMSLFLASQVDSKYVDKFDAITSRMSQEQIVEAKTYIGECAICEKHTHKC